MIAAASTLGFEPSPLRTVTELTSLLVRPLTPSVAGVMVVMSVGAEGSVRSTTWIPTFEDANARLDSGSNAGISAPASGMLPFNVEVYALLAMEHLLEEMQPGMLAPRLEPLRARLTALLGSAAHTADEVRRRVTAEMVRAAPRPAPQADRGHVAHVLRPLGRYSLLPTRPGSVRRRSALRRTR